MVKLVTKTPLLIIVSVVFKLRWKSINKSIIMRKIIINDALVL